MGLRPPRKFSRTFVAGLLLILCFSTPALAENETGTLTGIRFSMVPQTVPGQPAYKEGSGGAFIGVQGWYLSVHFGAEGMAGGAHFALVLLVDTKSHSVANFTTGLGESEAEGWLSLPPGTYTVGIKVLDTSSFASPTTVMISNPTTQSLSVGMTTSTTTPTTVQTTQSITTVQGGKPEEDGIHSAIQNSFIAAVVDVGASGSSVRLNDRNFSASVGRYQQGGYIVSISGLNGTGPKAILVNVTSAQSRSVLSGPILISFDGARVQQASSLLQILSARAGDPPKFIIILTSSSLELLVTIPHFSSHVVAIAPIIASVQALIVNLRLFVASVTVVTALVAVIYSRRSRVVV